MEYQLNHQEITSAQHTLEIVLIADNLQRPANYGMLIRMAESMGIQEIFFVTQEYTELTAKMKRSSRSTENNLKVYFTKDISEVIQSYKKRAYNIIGLEYTSESVPLQNHKLHSKKMVLLVGNEALGLSPEGITQTDVCIHLPMYGKNSSMNVVMASGITLWTLIHA